MSQLLVFSEKEARDQRLDELYDRISSFCCEHGPQLVTRGMHPEEANEGILACLALLLSRAEHAEKASREAHEDKTSALNRLQLANRIIDALPSYSAGMSFAAEEDVREMLEKFDAKG